MEVLSAELQSACSSLGTWDGKKYIREEDTLECVKDLIRYLRKDDENHEIRRMLGDIGVFATDIIHILKEFPDDRDLFEASLRLAVNLTNPEILLFREELPEDKRTRNFYLELTNRRIYYKESLRDLSFWSVICAKLLSLLRKSDHSEEEDLLLERILILIRNVLQIPDKDAGVHDEILWALHRAGIGDLLLFIASSDDYMQYCLHVLEIISLIFRNQTPEVIARTSLDGKSEKKFAEEELLKAKNKEDLSRRAKPRPSRHSRFGGTYVVKSVKSISGESLIFHKSIDKTKNLSFDEEKRPKRRSQKFVAVRNEESVSSSLSVRLFLKEFSIEFLNGAYNVLMQTVRDLLNRQKAQQHDDSYYLWTLRFFMKFNRSYKFRAELITETLNKGTFHYVHQQIDSYKDNMENEKKNPPKFKVWSMRLQLALLAYQELLFNVVQMENSKDPLVKSSGESLKFSIFYESEYRDLCLQLLLNYSQEKMSMSYLRDLVETTHVFIKVMEHMAKSKRVIVKVKKRRAKTSKKNTKSSSQSVSTALVTNKIELWAELASEVADLLSGPKESLPTDIQNPYDPLSELSMDQQRKNSILCIQKQIMEKNLASAVATLRISREIWPENDIFGPSDVDPEDEAIILKDILVADITDDEIESYQVVDDEAALNEGLEDEEEEEEIIQTSESELNIKDFIRDFATRNVCIPYSILFANFDKNSDYTNHCILKMFHRIAFDCKLPAMLFMISIFDTFRKIGKAYSESLKSEKENGTADKSLKEMVKFAIYVFQKFTKVAETNNKVYMELCFWKNVQEAVEIVEGYGTQEESAKSKKSYWSEEDEETLIRVFQQFRDMEDKPEDILDSITLFFGESGKSRRQVARKLKMLGLIQNTREITKKPIVNKRSNWTDEDIEDLKEIFNEFKDSTDPVSRIKERLKGKKSKPVIIQKILELGMCDDSSMLRKQKSKKSRSNNDSSSDSSSDEDEDPEALTLEELETRFRDNLKTLMDKGFSEELTWIAECLVEEAEDKDDEDPYESVPLIPMSESQGLALESPDFQSFLRDLNILSPNAVTGEKYWRMSGTSESLKSRASLITEGVKSEFQNFTTLIPSFKKIKKPKESICWLPMKRSIVDQNTLDRINNLFGLKDPEVEIDSLNKTPGTKIDKNSSNSAIKKSNPRPISSMMKESSDSDSDEGETPSKKRKKIIRRSLSDSLSSTERDESVTRGTNDDDDSLSRGEIPTLKKKPNVISSDDDSD